MKKKTISALGLSAIMALNMMVISTVSAPDMSAMAATIKSDKLLETSTWFYDQLNSQSQKIYNALSDMYNKGIMEDGHGSYDLVANNVIDTNTVKNYLSGDSALFNNFAAAKDAWDLEHPEAWYVDSSYLSMRTTQDSEKNYHVYIGPGRSDNYYVQGVVNANDVRRKTEELDNAVNNIVTNASGTNVEKIRYVHRQIINSISYRFENECTKGNAGYVRTAYGLVTQEGVCEAYSRTMQLVLNELGIDCVPVHGIQTSGEPEAHMWNAVKVDGEWYVIDATWDDPVALDKNGKIKTTGIKGVDGGENEKYLLVGNDIIRQNWHEFGQVSSGSMEFAYPDIADYSYGKGVLEKNGLLVTFDDGLMEEADSTVYKISFNGDGLSRAAEKGYYFLIKMYDVNADGSVDCFEDWYYPAHMLHAMGNEDEFTAGDNLIGAGNKFYTDTENYLIMNVANCEYVEFAITTKAPPEWRSPEDLLTMDGYYKGDHSDILAETGLMYNERGGYEQPPYVTNATPGLTSPITAGRNYHIHAEFTDLLYHPDRDDVDNAPEGKLNDAETAMNEDVGLDYTGVIVISGIDKRLDHEFQNKPAPKNVVLSCDTHGKHTDFAEADNTCRISAIDYDFTSSKMWGDDGVLHSFYLTGLVGVKSNKYANNWSYKFEGVYPFDQCKAKTGFDWNLWGQPMLLDNPNDLDLEAMTVMGVDGKEQSLAELRDSMNLDENDMNGRLTLVVENLYNNREKTVELENALENQGGIPSEAILSKSLYEIDFTRVCRCNIVKTGQSVRLCIGFPQGFDSTMEGVTFKAFHFTRNDDGVIISVEEIPCTVTRYGLVVVCNNFSPFEIVALDNDYLSEDEIDTGRSVIVSYESGGVIVVDDTVANGVNGIIKLDKGEKVTLTALPDDNMRLMSLNINGKAIGDNTVTVSYDDIEDNSVLISALFISDAIARSDEDSGESIIVPYEQSNGNGDSDNNDGTGNSPSDPSISIENDPNNSGPNNTGRPDNSTGSTDTSTSNGTSDIKKSESSVPVETTNPEDKKNLNIVIVIVSAAVVLLSASGVIIAVKKKKR